MNKFNNLKEKFNSVVFMWISVVLGAVALLMMFVPALKTLGPVYSSVDIFWGNKTQVSESVYPVFIGYMFILLASLMTLVIALPFIKVSLKIEAATLISSCVLFAAGAFIIFFLKPITMHMNGIVDSMRQFYVQYPGPYLAGSFALLAACSTVIALKYDL